MNKIRDKIFSILLALVVFTTVLYIPAEAAETSVVTVRTALNENGRYSSTDEFSAGDTVCLIFHFSGIAQTGVQGIAFDITYDADALKFSEKTFAALSDENAVFYKYAKGNRITILWETLSTDTVFNGDVFYVVFEAGTVEKDTNLTFSVNVTELYSSEQGNPDVISDGNAALSTNCTAVLLADVISEDFTNQLLTAIDKLKNITKDSLDDIVAAELLWKDPGFSNYQKQHFMEHYADDYTLLSTARTRYNQVMNQLKIDEINELVEQFKSDYEDVLKLTSETVSVQNEADIMAAQTAYEVLPTSVTTRLDSGIPKLFDKLLTRIEELHDAREEADSWIESYSYLADVSDVMLDISFSLYSAAVDEALILYNMTSPDAQALVSELHGKIIALKDKIDAITAADEAAAAVRAEINAFQQKWLKVFMLNTGNVTVADRTAIELALEDYKTLGTEAQTGLAPRITMLNKLLKVIEGLEKTTDKDSSGDIVDGNGAGETIVEKEVIRDVMVTAKEYIHKQMSKIIWWLFILLGVAVLTLLFPLIMTIRYKKCIAHSNPSQKSVEKEEKTV